MMREIAVKTGNFRGVCPTIGRLKDLDTAYIAADGWNRPAFMPVSFVPRSDTHESVYRLLHRTEDEQDPSLNFVCNKEENPMAVQKEMIRIRLKAYDHQLIDQSAEKIVETAKRSGDSVSGPIPLPTKKEVVTFLRAVH